MKHKKHRKKSTERQPAECALSEGDEHHVGKLDPKVKGSKNEGSQKVSAYEMRESSRKEISDSDGEKQGYNEGESRSEGPKRKKQKKNKKKKDVQDLPLNVEIAPVDAESSHSKKRKSIDPTELDKPRVKKRKSSDQFVQSSPEVLVCSMEPDIQGKKFSETKKSGTDINLDDSQDSHEKDGLRKSSVAPKSPVKLTSEESLQEGHREHSSGRKEKKRGKKKEKKGEQDEKTEHKQKMDIVHVDQGRSLMDGGQGGSSASRHEKSDRVDGRFEDSEDLEETIDGPVVLKTATGALLILPHPTDICVKGRADVKSLCGSVLVLGFEIKPSEKFYKIYSPDSHSLLTIGTVFGETNNNLISQAIRAHAVDGADLKRLNKYRGEIVVLLVENLECHMCDFVTTVPPYQQLFTKPESRGNKHIPGTKVLSGLGLHLVTDERFPHTLFSEDQYHVADLWKQTLEQFDPEAGTGAAPVIVVCGGKNSGKSTMNRFLINTALNVVDKVCYLECDIGQTEFTPPGCVAFQTIEEPVIGPPFTHQWQPSHMCCYGSVSPADDPRFYIRCVQEVFEQYKKMAPRVPLVINTMGWNKGLGLLLFMDTLRITSPDMVVQLDVRKLDMNFPAITPGFRAETDGFTTTAEVSADNTEPHSDIEVQKHRLVIIKSVVEPRHVAFPKMKPIDHRNLSLLGYLAADLEPGLTLTAYPPYSVPWNEIAVHVSHVAVPKSQIMCSLNATVVALCSSDLSEARRENNSWPWTFNKTPLCRCLGFGYVRGVDPELKLVYVATPLPLNQLERVNTLLRGVTSLPDQLLLKQNCSSGVPYVDDTYSSTGASALRARRHMPRRQKPEYGPR